MPLFVINVRKTDCLLGLLGHVGVLGAELFNAASFNDTRLSARVERVAVRRRIQLDQRIGHAINFNGFFRLSRRLDDEGLVDGQVAESNFTIFRVNTLFHC